MPLIEFEYEKDGKVYRFEELIRGPVPDTLIKEIDGVEVIGVRVMSLPARRDRNWGSWDDGDLPAVDASPDVLKWENRK